VNLVLFEPAEIDRPLPRSDRRAAHILGVLRRRAGDVFDAGLLNGPRGKGTVLTITDDALTLAFTWETTPPTREAITLLVGLPRPQTARDILRDATSLGVTALHFVQTEKSEASYAQSTLWSSGEWRRHLIAGAEQAFDTHIPEVSHHTGLPAVLAQMPAHATRLALDNYESPSPLGACELSADTPAVLAIGGERGWSTRERELLREHAFAFVHLGSRVLRTETAVIAAVAILRSRRGRM
jgi:RsmE family RNA methyltransferase